MFDYWGKKKKVITRIAPSPTGNLHIGTARTALFNYIYAKQNNGEFILRIEDTDRERSKEEYEKNIVEGLEWLGIHWDKTYKQSDRTEIYKEWIKKLIDENKAYISKEQPKEEGQRGEVIRFKNPNKKISFKDIVRGKIEFDTTELGDFVIAKSLDEPLYHLAAVIDDYEMEVSHIIRGEDHISNTPRQILIQEAIGAPRPKYAHIALTLNKDGSKLSKRDGEVAISDYKEMGYLSEAFGNFLVMLGWAPKDKQEIFSLKEMTQTFRIEDLQKGGAVFNLEKLDWFNKEWIKKITDEQFISLIKSEVDEIDNNLLLRALPEIRERISKIKGIGDMFREGGEFEYLLFSPSYKTEDLNWKNNENEVSSEHLKKVLSLIGTIEPDDFQTSKIKEVIFPYADEEGRGDVLWPYRFALSGKDKSILLP
jgi:glutamyl-tRNA synthetase